MYPRVKQAQYRIRQKIRGIKFSPIARPLYWGKIFAKFNFANHVRSTLQEVVGGAGHTVLCACVYVRTGYHVPRSKLKVTSVSLQH